MTCPSPHHPSALSRRTLLAVAGLFCLLTAVSAQAAGPKVVNVYSGRHYDTDRALYDRFTEETGIQVKLIESPADTLIERLKAEGKASPADVLITVDAGRLWRAEEAGLFQPVHSSVLDANIPASLRHPEGLWFGLSKRVRGIVYARDRVTSDEAPKRYEDLTDPKWRGRVCIRSSNNVYNQSLLGSIIAADGDDAARQWAAGLRANLAHDPRGSDTDQIRAVAAGECDVAVVNHYYYLRLATSTEPADRKVADTVRFVAPNQADRGAHVNISGAGVARYAPHRDYAIRFLEYLSTPEAQTLLASGNDEYPANPAVKPVEALKLIGPVKEDTVNAAVFGRNNAEALAIADEVGWK